MNVFSSGMSESSFGYLNYSRGRRLGRLQNFFFLETVTLQSGSRAAGRSSSMAYPASFLKENGFSYFFFIL